MANNGDGLLFMASMHCLIQCWLQNNSVHPGAFVYEASDDINKIKQNKALKYTYSWSINYLQLTGGHVFSIDTRGTLLLGWLLLQCQLYWTVTIKRRFCWSLLRTMAVTQHYRMRQFKHLFSSEGLLNITVSCSWFNAYFYVQNCYNWVEICRCDFDNSFVENVYQNVTRKFRDISSEIYAR